jgi:hypothetical protein
VALLSWLDNHSVAMYEGERREEREGEKCNRHFF